MSFYEKHEHNDPNFRVFFHKYIFDMFPAHWHEGIEIIYIINGSGFVISDAERINYTPGDMLVFNSNSVHTMHSHNGVSEYFCLTVDKGFCDDFGFSPEDKIFVKHIRDDKFRQIFYSINDEITKKDIHYKALIKVEIVSLFIHLQRSYVGEQIPLVSYAADNNKTQLVKSAINYISRNFKERITIDDICSHVGFSKFYFCHVFKEITGQTVMDYVNINRCRHAQRLLLSGQYNVEESANLSGYYNPSAFSVTFKKYMGISPSKVSKLNK